MYWKVSELVDSCRSRREVIVFLTNYNSCGNLAFLNLNGHTYLRLDGATDVDRRQRLMDRFNADTKIFCKIDAVQFLP